MTINQNPYYRISFYGAISCMLAVIIMALGAHALKEILNENQLNSVTTASRIQLIHGIVAVFSFQLYKSNRKRFFMLPVKLTFIGSLVFSISIYLLVMAKHLGINGFSFLGPITPIGGVLMIVGWAILAYKLFSISQLNEKED